MPNPLMLRSQKVVASFFQRYNLSQSKLVLFLLYFPAHGTNKHVDQVEQAYWEYVLRTLECGD